MPVFRRRRGYRLGLRRRRFGGPLRRRYGVMSRRRRTVIGRPFIRPRVDKSDVSVQDATIDIAGVVQAIAQNPSVGGQAGRNLRVKYLYWRCKLTWPATTGVGAQPLIRVILFIDKQGFEGSLVPTVAGATDGVLQTATVTSALNPDTAGRYVILSDRTMSGNAMANAADAAGVGNTTPIVKFYKLFKRLNLFQQEVTAGTFRGQLLYCLYLTESDEIGAIDALARAGAISMGA